MSTNSSDPFERRLQRALDVPVPRALIEDLQRIPTRERPSLRPRHLALAAGLLIAVSLAFTAWHLDLGTVPIEEYVARHYHHDGPLVLEQGSGRTGYDVSALLEEFDLAIEDAIAGRIGFMMVCPTPEGIGLHFMVHTDAGPITVILMPERTVTDGRRFAFDGMHAELVSLERGSAAIIGRLDQDIGFLHDTIQQSVRPRDATS